MSKPTTALAIRPNDHHPEMWQVCWSCEYCPGFIRSYYPCEPGWPVEKWAHQLGAWLRMNGCPHGWDNIPAEVCNQDGDVTWGLLGDELWTAEDDVSS